jgi:hypothetical protein
LAKTKSQPESYSHGVPWLESKDWPTLVILVGVCLTPIVLVTLLFFFLMGLGFFLEAVGG